MVYVLLHSMRYSVWLHQARTPTHILNITQSLASSAVLKKQQSRKSRETDLYGNLWLQQHFSKQSADVAPWFKQSVDASSFDHLPTASSVCFFIISDLAAQEASLQKRFGFRLPYL